MTSPSDPTPINNVVDGPQAFTPAAPNDVSVTQSTTDHGMPVEAADTSASGEAFTSITAPTAPTFNIAQEDAAFPA